MCRIHGEERKPSVSPPPALIGPWETSAPGEFVLGLLETRRLVQKDEQGYWLTPLWVFDPEREEGITMQEDDISK